MSRDTTGLPGYGHPITDAPTDTLRVTGAPGRSVLTPMRPKRMSIREYRERFDSHPHVVTVAATATAPAVRYRVCGAVSAAVIAHGHPDDLVTITALRPAATPTRRMSAVEGQA